MDRDPRFDAERQPVIRELLGDGEMWLVHEVAAPAFDRRGGTHLVFECAYVMRRLRSFPAHWASLSDVDLYALSYDIRDT